MKVLWTGAGRADVDAIWTYVAQDNVEAADVLAQAFHASSTLLEKFPKLGRAGRIRGTRELIVTGTPYLLIYRIVDRVEVLHVLHGARDWPPKRKRS